MELLSRLDAGLGSLCFALLWLGYGGLVWPFKWPFMSARDLAFSQGCH